jgi:hypothetical protein
MSKIIAISIPEELAVELKEFKKKINVSKLCRRAIMERLETLRTAQSGDLIQFLKISKGDFTKQFYDVGKKCARDAIRSMKVDYAAFIRIEELRSFAKMNDDFELNAETFKNSLSGDFLELWNFIFNVICQCDDKLKGYDDDAFALGFVDEISEIWYQIKSHI